MGSSATGDDFSLMEYVAARGLLCTVPPRATGVVRFSVLAPVQPSLGCGQLRILRVRPHADPQSAEAPVLEIIAGYESYERLEP